MIANNQCFKCGEVGHRFYQCPTKRTSEDSKEGTQGLEEFKNKKSRPSAGLIPDMVGEQQSGADTELCRAWGKVRDQVALIFFDPGAKANFISPELASQLGIRTEEMGAIHEASLAAPGHSVAVTPGLCRFRRFLYHAFRGV